MKLNKSDAIFSIYKCTIHLGYSKIKAEEVIVYSNWILIRKGRQIDSVDLEGNGVLKAPKIYPIRQIERILCDTTSVIIEGEEFSDGGVIYEEEF